MNETIVKFGYPATLVAEFTHWLVLLRPRAVTLGSLVLAAKGDATRYAALNAGAFAEKKRVVESIEAALDSLVGYEKINYLMLMMVDPHVHYHVVPRYRGSRAFAGESYEDAGWPGMPDLAGARPLPDAAVAAMVAALRKAGLQEPIGSSLA